MSWRGWTFWGCCERCWSRSRVSRANCPRRSSNRRRRLCWATSPLQPPVKTLQEARSCTSGSHGNRRHAHRREQIGAENAPSRFRREAAFTVRGGDRVRHRRRGAKRNREDGLNLTARWRARHGHPTMRGQVNSRGALSAQRAVQGRCAGNALSTVELGEPNAYPMPAMRPMSSAHLRNAGSNSNRSPCMVCVPLRDAIVNTARVRLFGLPTGTLRSRPPTKRAFSA